MDLMPLDDPNWSTFRGGCNRAIFDVVPLIKQLVQSGPSPQFWEEVWSELHHQGDVGEASYALVPYLAAWQASAPLLDEQVFHFAAVIELERPENNNPPLPGFLQKSYKEALRQLVLSGVEKMPFDAPEHIVMGVASLMALLAGRRVLARAYVDFSRDDALDYLRNLNGFEARPHDL